VGLGEWDPCTAEVLPSDGGEITKLWRRIQRHEARTNGTVRACCTAVNIVSSCETWTERDRERERNWRNITWRQFDTSVSNMEVTQDTSNAH
jgi:hypothetical protein